ncbi:hypothetical protein psyc5s11_27560 [Clostridium gelidum]|uniref:DUF4489 domain-containing protein n=1 Tax=Clostridium gelidum TaxID=704125 RepID=A0ABM7TCG9_9CLOT|nr:hypothetical protein [Clostridium gelidum]BCZ46689.1 hypothetical protein psyc5s11_27560 [Clostridium gelidum]
MKDIQEIMKEMNVVSDEIAATEDIAVTLEQVQQVLPSLGLACTCAQACSAGVSGLTECGTTDNSVEPTLCVATAPRNFVFDTGANRRIAYSLAGLRIVVEPCSCDTVATPIYRIRIIGCISYTVDVPLASSNNCTAEFTSTGVRVNNSTPTVYACCCCGSAHVDNIIGFACSLGVASLARNLIALLIASGLRCSFITPTLTVGFTGNNTIATASVGFNIQNVCTSVGGLTAEISKQ